MNREHLTHTRCNCLGQERVTRKYARAPLGKIHHNVLTVKAVHSGPRLPGFFVSPMHHTTS
jgi:hypothetical protein